MPAATEMENPLRIREVKEIDRGHG